MLRQVDSGCLVLRRNPGSHGAVDDLRHGEGDAEREDSDDWIGQSLLAQQRQSAAEEQTLGTAGHHLGRQ